MQRQKDVKARVEAWRDTVKLIAQEIEAAIQKTNSALTETLSAS